MYLADFPLLELYTSSPWVPKLRIRGIPFSVEFMHMVK